MSLQIQHDPKNEVEITYWNSTGGRRWVERQQSQEIVLGPILQATLERAQLRQGECVVDIGCVFLKNPSSFLEKIADGRTRFSPDGPRDIRDGRWSDASE